MNDLREIIAKELTPLLRKKLRAYAAKKTFNFKERSYSNRLNADDLVHQAILQVLEGERPWDREQTPNLFAHLAGCIKSNISNESILVEHRLTTSIDDHPIVVLDSQADTSSQKPDELIEEEDYHWFKEEQKSIVISVAEKDSPEMLAMVFAIFKEDIHSAEDLAKHLNLSVPYINNQKARLKRRCKSHPDFERLANHE